MQLLGTHPGGGERFTILRRIGAGSMGVVYEAHDRERDELVALKTLPHAEATALYRFKREFRALADTHHRNLVALHELFIDDHACFFTMERIVGAGFLEHVRPNDPSPGTDRTYHGPGTDELGDTDDADDDDADADDDSIVAGSTLGLDASLAPASTLDLDASLTPASTLGTDAAPVSTPQPSASRSHAAPADLDPTAAPALTRVDRPMAHRLIA